MRGTYLNTAAVAVGASLGLIMGNQLPHKYQSIALQGLGLVVIGLGVKMFLESKNPITTAASITVGGVIGLALKLNHNLVQLSQSLQHAVGGSGQFSNGLIASFVLFCVGPMTLLGCFEDALENKIEILGLKSIMDAISSFFLAAAAGAGVLFTALLLFVFQGTITLAARPMRKFVSHENLVSETTSVGGAILIATGLGLANIKQLTPVNYIPALLIAPIVVVLQSKIGNRRARLLSAKLTSSKDIDLQNDSETTIPESFF